MGVIPPDAIPGGCDIRNTTTYIGQGLYYDYDYEDDVGLLIGSVYPGTNKIKVACNAYVYSVKVGLKVGFVKFAPSILSG